MKDKFGKVANPGPNTRDDDDEFLSWWLERLAKETLDTRNGLNQKGNAISVIEALIATASYVGPLQPPLSYGSEFLLPRTILSMHIFGTPLSRFLC